MQCRYDDELLLELWMSNASRLLHTLGRSSCHLDCNIFIVFTCSYFCPPNAFLSLMNCKFHLYNVQVLLVRTCFIGKQQLWDHLTVPMLVVFS